MTILWDGPGPGRLVAAALRARGIAVLRPTAARGEAATAATLVIATEQARRLPALPEWATRGMSEGAGGGDGRPRWIWITARPVSDELHRAAIGAGACDVIALPGAGGEDRSKGEDRGSGADRGGNRGAVQDAIATLIARIEELSIADPPIPDADGLVSASAASRRAIAQVARVAPTTMPVLLTGETGTGKEVFGRLIHAWSPRRAKQFVPINCAAIPNELMEAELFGYARGAFSGAVQRYDGQLMAAEGGTVFMDEIDDTPPATQVKLLRVLEDRIVSRLGENVWHQVDFRIIAATNRDLAPLIDSGAFGNDLYERLAIVTIALLPLRERPEDLPALARHFIARFAREQPQTGASRVRDIRADALRALADYAWPGNIRELRNVLYETLVYKRAGEEIILSDLPPRILTRAQPASGPATIDARVVADKIARGGFDLCEEVSALERLALREALSRTGGNAARAARLLGRVGRGRASDPGGTVRAMMRRLGFDTNTA